MIIKYLKIIIINLFLIYIAFLVSDFIIFKNEIKNIDKTYKEVYSFWNPIFNPKVNQLNTIFSGESDIGQTGRAPDLYTKEDKKEGTIVVFGCSFAFGQFLEKNKTFSYKLSHLLKKSVYNRAICGGSVQYMYYQSTSERFYKEVPKSDTIIYVMMDDHYRRMMGEIFQIPDEELYLHYKYKNGKFIMDNYNNVILNALKQSFTLKKIRNWYKNKYISDDKKAEEVTDLFIQYFIETRKNLNKKWNNNIKFNIIFYDEIKHENLLRSKLENNGFKVISTKDLTKENLNTTKYKMQDNGHPTEETWDLLTPKIIEKLDL